MMDVKDIVKKYLEDNGYDGLCNDECGCSVNDLMPCTEESIGSCEPGYEVECNDCEYAEGLHLHYRTQLTDNEMIKKVKAQLESMANDLMLKRFNDMRKEAEAQLESSKKLRERIEKKYK